MASEVELMRLECLREAIKVCTSPLTHNDGNSDPVALAREFAGFVLGLTYDEEADEWVGPEEDPIEIEIEEEDDFDPNADVEPKHTVRAFNDDGQEL